ncbi:MAG: DUF2231 domain-containing protein [Desulfobulbaceae bacterium]|nr:DUF2231 domain-containing protein [Desulfobulbaceae bacterium]
MQKEFNRESLAEFNGRDGKPSYIARDGSVYDVSDSKLWQNGEHMKRHHAGEDLSADLSAAPHGPEVFERYPRIGSLKEESSAETADQRIPAWLNGLLERYPMMARHPHPMLVHFPIAFMIAVPLFSLLAFLTGRPSFETTAFHCLGAGLLFTPLTIGTGIFTWWLNYHAGFSRPITIKMIGSALLMALIIILFVWRYGAPDIFFAGGGAGIVYVLLLFSLIPVVSVVGWYGARLTFPTEKKK